MIRRWLCGKSVIRIPRAASGRILPAPREAGLRIMAVGDVGVRVVRGQSLEIVPRSCESARNGKDAEQGEIRFVGAEVFATRGGQGEVMTGFHGLEQLPHPTCGKFQTKPRIETPDNPESLKIWSGWHPPDHAKGFTAVMPAMD